MTRVVNIYKEDCDVYIGRGGYIGLGNIHVIGYCMRCDTTHTREEAIEAFRKDFMARIKNDEAYRKEIMELKDKKLGCFCKPQKCHGDVYVEYLEGKI